MLKEKKVMFLFFFFLNERLHTPTGIQRKINEL